MKTCKAMAIMVEKRIWKENKATHGFVIVGSKDDMLLNELNTRSINRKFKKLLLGWQKNCTRALALL
jgi:hypothetical protein